MIIKNTGTRECICFEEEDARILVILPCDLRDQDDMENEVREIQARTSVPFSLIAVPVDNWNRDLSPWEAPPVFGKEGFGSGAYETLAYIIDTLIPAVNQDRRYQKILLGGYSLAGLFALWAGYETDVFDGIAAVSPSVWFEGWDTYREEHAFQAGCVYLSLGDKEEKTRNRTMAQVGDRIRSQAELFEKENTPYVLEWNPGNHFKDADLRMAKGFVWLLSHMD